MYISNSYSYLNRYANSPFVNKDIISSIFGRADKNQFFPGRLNLSDRNYVNTAALGHVVSMKTNSAELKRTIDALSSGSLYLKRAPTSSNTDKMTVGDDPAARKFSGVNTAKVDSVRIEQLAVSQKNTGLELDSSAAVDLSDAEYQRFTVEIGGRSRQITVRITPNDTVLNVQNKIVAAVNEASMGVTAKVAKNDAKSAITLESSETGSAGTFKILDEDGGDLAERFGLNTVTQEAQDAVYYINGSDSAKTSASNTVSLGFGVTAEFKQASDETISVGQGLDTEEVLARVKDFAKSYNTLFAQVRDYDDNRGDRLLSKMVSVNRVYASQLSSLGIQFDDKGEMVVDGERVKKTAADGKLEKFFADGAGLSYGYANQMAKTADSAGRNTASYIDRNVLAANLELDSFGYYTPFKPGGVTANSLGLLLDFMF